MDFLEAVIRKHIAVHFQAVSAMPTARQLIDSGANPYAAHMYVQRIAPVQMVDAMELDGYFGMIDWPAALPIPKGAEILDQMFTGLFRPEADMVGRFCDGAGITPDQLTRTNDPLAARPEIVEAALWFLEDRKMPRNDRRRIVKFLAGEVTKARAYFDAKLTPLSASNRTILENVESMQGYKKGSNAMMRDRDIIDGVYIETIVPIAAIRERWVEGFILYDGHLRQNVRETYQSYDDDRRPLVMFDEARYLHVSRRDHAVTELQDFEAWRRAPQTEYFLQAEANAREILAHLSMEALNLQAAPVKQERSMLGLPSRRVQP